MEWLVQDVRFAWRALRNSPKYAAIAIVALPIGIGSNTIFSVVNSVLLRPLQFAGSRRLVPLSTCSDPLSPIVVCAVLVICTLSASTVLRPCARKVDPMVAVRFE